MLLTRMNVERQVALLNEKLPLETEQDDQHREELQFLEKAKTDLGYCVPHPSIALRQQVRAAVEETSTMIKFLRLLDQLCLAPFDIDSVESHKRAMWKKSNPFPVRHDCFFVILVGCLIISLGLGCALWVLDLWSGRAAGIGAIVILVVFLLVAIWCCVATEKRVEWQRTRLSEYSQQVPSFALQTALDIRKEFPNIQFFVSSLGKPELEKLDPFLVVELAGSSFYIEVWNEPGFDKKRVV